MKHSIAFLMILGSLVFVAERASALEYLWLTNSEQARFGYRIEFWHGDTLDGPVHSNDYISIHGDPVFYDQVSSSRSHYFCSMGCFPRFLGPLPVFNAPRVEIPSRMEMVRQAAASQGYFFPDNNSHYLIRFEGDMAYMYRWPRGAVVDSTDNWYIDLNNRRCIFVDAPLRVYGIVEGGVTVGSSQLIEIEDDIRYVDSDPLTGETPLYSHNLLGLVSEGDIKIRNTFANGRGNSGGLGVNQTNRDSTSVVITAALYALGGSFTFENQNDPDSGYVCECLPDDRGTIYLYGGIVQEYRGYTHRSTRNSTGYKNHFRYDQRFHQIWPPYTINFSNRETETTDTLDFGDVIVGTTAWDTAYVYIDFDGYLGSVYANYPFYSVRQMPFQGNRFIIPTRFTPPRVGTFTGILYVSCGDEFCNIILRGRGIAAGAPMQLSLDVSPNPFNLMTAIRYTLPESGTVKLILYDVLGREAKRIEIAGQAAGAQVYHLDAAELSSGVYFLNLQTATHHKTAKLLLVK